MTDASGTPSLQDDLLALERVVRALEAEEGDLDRALALFEEGVARLRRARARLADAELQVRTVLEQADGTLTTDALDG